MMRDLRVGRDLSRASARDWVLSGTVEKSGCARIYTFLKHEFRQQQRFQYQHSQQATGLRGSRKSSSNSTLLLYKLTKGFLWLSYNRYEGFNEYKLNTNC